MKTTVNTTLLALLSTISMACATGVTDEGDSGFGQSEEQETGTQGSNVGPLGVIGAPTNENSSSNVGSTSQTSVGVGSGGDATHDFPDGSGTGSDGGDGGQGGAGGSSENVGASSSMASSSSGGVDEPPPPPPPPPQPLSGCADSIDMLGEVFWSRVDIVFCGTADKKLPANLSAAKAMCSPGWHLCTSKEFTERNDLCPAHKEKFSAVLDSGENCIVHDSGSNCPDCWVCNGDNVLSGSDAGTCQGTQSQSGFGMVKRYQNITGPGPHGSLCCL